MAFFRRRKSPFAHEIDRFHVQEAPRQFFGRSKRKGPPETYEIDRFHIQKTPRRFFVRRRLKGSSEAAKEGTRSSDLTIAALGIGLGLICALFPGTSFSTRSNSASAP